jgi:predicted transcriptional regulator
MYIDVENSVMASSIVKDVFSKEFVKVNQNEVLSACLSLFKEEMPPVLVVVDNKGKYKGVIAHRWIIQSRLDLSTTKVETLMRSAPTVTLEHSLSKVATLMINSGIMQLPVFSGEKLMGIITDEDVIHGAVLGKWGNSKVEEIMIKKPFVIEEEESVGAVLSLFREHGISHVPVVSDGKLVGIVSISDIIKHIFQPRQRQTVGDIVGEKVPVLSILAKGVMTKPVITVLPETTLKDAEGQMHKHNISSLVVASKGRPIGILTKRDFLEPLAELAMPRERITIQFSAKHVRIHDGQREVIMGDFEAFTNRYKEMVETGTLFVYMKTHGTNYKGERLIHCRLQFRTPKGSFFSSGEGFGVEQTFRIALDRIERQILRSKEFSYDPIHARKYLGLIDFP